MTAPAVTPGAIPVAERRVSGGLWSDAGRRLLRNKPAVFGLACIMLFVFVALFAPVIAPYGPLERPGKSLEPPSPQFIMGTDLQGRDQFSRILYGAQISLQVGVVAVIMALFFGVIIGAAAGLGEQGRRRAHALDRRPAVDPGILLAIGIVAWLDRGLWQLMLAIAVTYAPIFARLLRGSLLALRESDYVIAARSVGASGGRVLSRHMIPNALTPLIVQATLVLATAIIDIAGLSLLGLGRPTRARPSGGRCSHGRRFLATAPWLVFFPGIAIVISAIGFNLLGDGMRESLDPRLKR